MELFNKKFVYFMWDDCLKDEWVFVADTIGGLAQLDTSSLHRVENSGGLSAPFRVCGEEDCCYQFAYYDPNYEVKKAYEEGKQIQYKATDAGRWCDWDESLCSCDFSVEVEYRIKPVEPETVWVPFENLDELLSCWNRVNPHKQPENTMPLIWVKEKETGIKQLITGLGDTVVKFSLDYTTTLKSLFMNYEFLDNSPCGKVIEVI